MNTTQKYENSLQTGVRWAWSSVVAMSWACIFYRIFRTIFPARKALSVPDPRDIVSENAEYLRKAELTVGKFKEALREEAEILEKTKSLPIVNRPTSESSYFGDLFETPEESLRRLISGLVVVRKDAARKLLAQVEVPTKRQAAQVRRLAAVLDRDDARTAALREKFQRQFEEDDRRNIPKLYDYLVKNGHLDPRITLEQFRRRAYPEPLISGKPLDVSKFTGVLKLAAAIVIPSWVVLTIAARIIAPELFPF